MGSTGIMKDGGWFSRRGVTALALALLVATNLVLLCLPGALPRLLHRVLVRGDRTPVQLMTGLDEFLREAVPEGNVLLRFHGFAPASAPGATRQGAEVGRPDPACLIYVRAVHALYPRRVYVGPEDTPVVLGSEFVGMAFAPDAAWLRARDVRNILTFSRDAVGNIYQRLEPVPGE